MMCAQCAQVNNMGYDQYGCCAPAGVSRRFATRAERIERLKEYKEALENEAQAVRERIEEIEKA